MLIGFLGQIRNDLVAYESKKFQCIPFPEGFNILMEAVRLGIFKNAHAFVRNNLMRLS
jgi:hypothetical protein